MGLFCIRVNVTRKGPTRRHFPLVRVVVRLSQKIPPAVMREKIPMKRSRLVVLSWLFFLKWSEADHNTPKRNMSFQELDSDSDCVSDLIKFIFTHFKTETQHRESIELSDLNQKRKNTGP